MQTDKRNHNIKSDYGIKDYYKYYKKTSKNPVDYKTYAKLLKKYLKSIQILISKKGYIYVIPKRMGRIELRKVKREVKLDANGKIINNLPIDWKSTKELWEKNKIAKEKKIRLRHTNEHTNGYVFRIIYVKYTATFKNKSIYKMHLNREMRRNTEEAITSGKLDAFLLIPNK